MATASEVKQKRKGTKAPEQTEDDVKLVSEILKEAGIPQDKIDSFVENAHTDGLEAFGDVIVNAMQSLNSSPEGQARLRATMERNKTARISERYAPFFQTAFAGGDIVGALSQIRQAKRAAGDLTKPGLPPVPNIDPALNQQIADAQRGTYDTARVAGPAKQLINDQYAKDIARANSIGGGQASTAGAMGQIASLRRARAAAGLVPALDSIKAREQGRLDNLIGKRGDRLDQNYRNRFYQYRALQDQYNTEASAIGALGSAGRSNLRSSAQSLLNNVPGVIARTPGVYEDKYSPYEQTLNRSLVTPPDRRQQLRQLEEDNFNGY